jgi:hypothetical protein
MQLFAGTKHLAPTNQHDCGTAMKPKAFYEQHDCGTAIKPNSWRSYQTA